MSSSAGGVGWGVKEMMERDGALVGVSTIRRSNINQQRAYGVVCDLPVFVVPWPFNWSVASCACPSSDGSFEAARLVRMSNNRQ